MSRLLAISDIHINHVANQEAVASLGNYRDDWLILAGDIGNGPDDLRTCLESLSPRFAQIVWAPGNHDLWTLPADRERGEPVGVARYEQLVSLCRRFGVLTPEDPFATWTDGSDSAIVAPLFTLYDYSFRPRSVAAGDALQWAADAGIVCADEHFLSSAPFPTLPDWCHQRIRYSEQRLDEVTPTDGQQLVLVNHYPLVEQLVRLPRIPRFSLWCGTLRTSQWHTQYDVDAVVYGHLHIRSSDIVDGVRFEEVSFGYPNQRRSGRTIDSYLVQIKPNPVPADRCKGAS